MTQTRQDQQNEFEKAWEEPGPIVEAVAASQNSTRQGASAEARARAARDFERGDISADERAAIEKDADAKDAATPEGDSIKRQKA